MSRLRRLRIVASVVAAWSLIGALAPAPAVAVMRSVDTYCSTTGDFCSGVFRRSNGTVLFLIDGFANYFGTVTVCVTRETTVCRTMEPRAPEPGSSLYGWKMRWQRAFPFEGFGLYRVKMTADWGHWIGNRDYRFWYSRGNAAPEHLPPSPSPTPTPSPSA